MRSEGRLSSLSQAQFSFPFTERGHRVVLSVLSHDWVLAVDSTLDNHNHHHGFHWSLSGWAFTVWWARHKTLTGKSPPSNTLIISTDVFRGPRPSPLSVLRVTQALNLLSLLDLLWSLFLSLHFLFWWIYLFISLGYFFLFLFLNPFILMNSQMKTEASRVKDPSHTSAPTSGLLQKHFYSSDGHSEIAAFLDNAHMNKLKLEKLVLYPVSRLVCSFACVPSVLTYCYSLGLFSCSCLHISMYTV